MANDSESPTVGIVTGAARGMGYVCAARLVETVDTVLLVDLDEDGARAAAESLPKGRATLEPFPADVTDLERLAALATRVAELGTFRSLVHAAGISPTMADWKRVLQVDLVGSARLLGALEPLVSPGTAAVLFASMAAHMVPGTGDAAADAILGEPLDPALTDRLHEHFGEVIEHAGLAYGWAKRGVQLLARSTAIGWGPIGGRVNSVSPGIIDTPMGRAEEAEQPFMAVMLEHSPIPRRGRPDDLADAVSFLLSDQAAFMTGTDLLVDGGVVAALPTMV